MSYKVESLKLEIGKGIRIEQGNIVYEHINFNNNFLLRSLGISKPQEHYDITLSRYFNNSNSDYKLFKDLTDKLSNLFNTEIKNNSSDYKTHFNDYGLEQLLDGNLYLIINGKRTYSDSPPSLKEFRNKKFGRLINNLVYGGLLTGVIPLITDQFQIIKIPAAAVLVAFSSVAISFLIKSINLDKKIDDPNYLLEKFLKNNKKLENLAESDKYEKYEKINDTYFSALAESISSKPYLRGFYLVAHGPDREAVFDFFMNIVSTESTEIKYLSKSL